MHQTTTSQNVNFTKCLRYKKLTSHNVDFTKCQLQLNKTLISPNVDYTNKTSTSQKVGFTKRQLHKTSISTNFNFTKCRLYKTSTFSKTLTLQNARYLFWCSYYYPLVRPFQCNGLFCPETICVSLLCTLAVWLGLTSEGKNGILYNPNIPYTWTGL